MSENLSTSPSHNGSGQPGDHLRVAIVGAGPTGFYATIDLLKREHPVAHVDLFDRLPAPYGLVRYGVAPDHQKIKNVVKVYERGVEKARDRFRFFGNVDLGRDISLEDLTTRYDAVILSYGAQSDRQLGIPGEDLPGVYAAREFVAWYNGHPDFSDEAFDLSAENVMVVGVGNVAIDVARILQRTKEELWETDMSEAALDALAENGAREVTVLARRGPLQAKNTPVELKELTHMAAADLVIPESELALDPLSQADWDADEVDSQNRKNYKMMQEEALREPDGDRDVILFRFYWSPVEILGTDRVEAVRIQRNTLRRTEEGWLVTEPTDEIMEVPCDAVYRSIGYLVAPIPGVPFNEKRARIPHDLGQVLAEPGGDPVPGLFVAGWAKRGPSGVIGTNKPDAVETVATMLAAREAGNLPAPTATDDIEDVLAAREVRRVTYDDWRKLDELERAAGEAQGRPRIKFDSVAEMLAALGDAEGAPS